MKANKMKIIAYIILFAAFLIIRTNYIFQLNSIVDIDFKTLAIASSSFPFEIIKNTALLDCFSPIYYLLIHFFLLLHNHEIIIRALNTIICAATLWFFIQTGKDLKGEKLALFLGVFVCLNRFFLVYTNLIAPYCLTFLISIVLIKYLLNFLKKPNKKNLNLLNIFNCLLVITDPLGFVYVLSELGVLYLYFLKKTKLKEQVLKLAYSAFFCFCLIFLLLIIQYGICSKLVIPNTYNSIGFNLEGLYLTINEYISPYLTFSMQPSSKSTLGLLYSYFLNPDIKNINTLKIALTIFYSSILPLTLVIFMSIRAFFKDYRLKILSSIALLNLLIVLFASILEIIGLHPIYLIQFYITFIILLGYGVFSIKDKFLRYIIVFSLIAIQFVNPKLNCFNITLAKKEAVLNPVKIFFQEYKIKKNDLIIMPYMGEFGKLYFKNLSFFNFSYSMLQKKSKNSIVQNIISKKTKTVNKYNIDYLLRDYLSNKGINAYIAKYFAQNIYNNNEPDRIILIVDKLNSRPVSQNAILKCSCLKHYSPSMRKINFKYIDLEQNQSKLLFDALKSKTLYGFIELLNGNFVLDNIVEYKKIDNEYYKVKEGITDIYSTISSFESDYVFIIFKDSLSMF